MVMAMDYEKLYKEALERAKQFHNKELYAECNGNLVEYIFPELKESEDERIRKRLLTNFSALGKEWWGGLKVKDILFWLEKQNKKPNDNDTPKFKVGDIISNGEAVYRVDGITKNCLGQDSYFLVNVQMEKNGTRYLIIIDSKGKTSYMGEITWLCEQVDRKFWIKEN